MLKSALLCLTQPAREPRGPPGPGSEPPHPDASPLQLPRRRKQQQKESRRRAPSSGHSPGSRAARVTGSEVGKKPNACTNAAQTFLYTPTLTHIHAQKRKTSWLTKKEGKHRGSGWAAAAPWATAAAAATASPPQFRPPPPQPPLVPLLGLGPLQPPHPPQAWRQEGWGEKRKGGGEVGKSTEQLPTWSSQ